MAVHHRRIHPRSRARRMRRPLLTVIVVGALYSASAVVTTADASPYAANGVSRVVVGRSTASLPWLDASKTPEERADELLAAMTLAEKVNMLHGGSTSSSPVHTIGYIAPIPRLDVPPITMTDGPAGVRSGAKATELPAPIAVGASWDPALAAQYGAVLGREARDQGQDQLFGPGLNIDRVALNGRNFEYFSEDPFLSGTIAGADVNGIQSQGTIATIKHYLANNDETNRKTVSADIDDRTLHEIYEKNFGIAVATGRPGSVMCGYNRINTVYACSNPRTLSDLRSQLGFDGYIVSDYGGTHATKDLTVGLNVELPTAKYFSLSQIQAGLDAHEITTAQIDQRVRETLIVLFRFGLFDRALTTTPIDTAHGNAVATTVEEQSAVLLKNSDAVLPLSSPHRIAVIGGTAKTSAQGGGSSEVDPVSVDNAYDAIVRRAGSHTTVTYNSGADLSAAAASATGADTALVFVRDYSAEASDRTTSTLPGNQDALIEAVAAANPHTVVVLETGAPALMPWLSQVRGVLEAWYPGARGGAAIAALLYGDVNPSGKLQQTWAMTDTQNPTSTPARYPGINDRESYSEGVNVGYRWYDTYNQQPLFSFGYGLSYTSFGYSGLRLSSSSGTSGQALTVSVYVTNTGTRTGSEVAQVYVGLPSTLATSPPRQLAAFAKVKLAPGQTERVDMVVHPSELSYWDSAAQHFTVQDGTYVISVGGSSRSLPRSASYRVTLTDGPVRLAATPSSSTVSAGASMHVTGTVRNLSDYVDSSAHVSVAAPSGWAVHALTATSAARLYAKSTLSSLFRVSVPASAHGTYHLSVTATGAVNGTNRSTSSAVTVTVPSG